MSKYVKQGNSICKGVRIVDNEQTIKCIDDSTITIHDLTNNLNTFFCNAKESVKHFLGNDQVQAVLSTGEDLAGALSFIRIIRIGASIPTKIFMKKYEKFINGITNIPFKTREKYFEKVGKSGLNKDSVFILNMLNRVEDLSKIDIFLSLFRAKIEEIIDDNTYRRLTLMVDRTMYSDLLFLKDHIKIGAFKIATCEEEALFSSGFILFTGIGWGTMTEEGGNLYEYSNTAKQICKIVFDVNKIPQIKNSHGVFAMQEVNNDKI